MKSPIYDVIVLGAGPAGLASTVQAARAGARTLLVEKSGILGGATVLNGVNFPGLFHAWGRQIIAGIGWELVSQTVEISGQQMPDFSAWRGLRHWRLQVLVDRAVYAALADRMVQDSGAELLLHAMPARIEPLEVGWEVTLCLKEGLYTVHTKVLIDCTGDANAVSLAGFPLSRNSTRQPGTLVMSTSGYELDTLDFDHLEEAFQQALARGGMLKTDLHSVRNFLSARGNNCMHVPDIDGETSAGKTEAEVRARAAMLRIFRFMRSQPGLGEFRIDHFATECGIRETATIIGETRITHRDYVSGRVWPDSVCYSFYPIDIHRSDSLNIDVRPLEEGVFPTIPLGALLPQGSRNLVVAGRTACGDQEANSAFRVQASAMAMGQAAGAVAALASAGNCELREVPIGSIHDLLQRHCAIVPSVA
jgi:hypothetical protein